MADTYTTNLNLTKPEPGAAEDTWGISLNADLDALDAIFSSSGTQINLNPNQINFADNKKAIFGTGSDLEIYHDGSNSYIKDVGTGSLILEGTTSTQIKGSTYVILRSNAGENMLIANANGSVDSYYDGVKKLETTTTGIDVTGTVTSDGFTVEGDSTIKGGSDVSNTGATLQLESTETQAVGSGASISFKGDDGSGTQRVFGVSKGSKTSATSGEFNGGLDFFTRVTSEGNARKRLAIASNGDISFYDDTGTTQGLFWDASAESLGIGTTSPSYTLDVRDDSNIQLKLSSTTTTNNARMVYAINNVAKWNHGVQASDSSFTFYDIVTNSSPFKIEQGAATNTLVVDSNSRVGIGTNSPNTPLHVQSSLDYITRFESTDTTAGIVLQDSSSTSRVTNTSGHLILSADISNEVSNSAIRFMLDTSSNASADAAMVVRSTGLGIGIPSPNSGSKLHIRGFDGASGASTNVAADEVFIENNGNVGITLGTPNTGTGYYAFADSDVALRGGIFYDHSTDDMGFRVASATAMTIDSSRNVGIGTTSPSNKLTVDGDIRIRDSIASLFLQDTDGTNQVSEIKQSAGITTISSRNNTSNGAILFTGYNGTATTEYARFNSSGDLLVSTTDNSPVGNNVAGGIALLSNGSGQFSRDGGTALLINRKTSDGELLRFNKDGAIVGSIGTQGGNLFIENGNVGLLLNDTTDELRPAGSGGVPNDNVVSLGASAKRFKDLYLSGTANVGNLTASYDKTNASTPIITANDSQSDTGQIIAVQLGGTTKGNIGISSATGNDMYIASGTTSSVGVGLRFIDYQATENIQPCRGDGSTLDNAIDLGSSGARFDDIYATNGTIQTSDRNEKQDIEALTDAETRVATACKGLLRRFRWQDAVTEKGDEARYHFGVIAQDLQDAFTAEGLDAGDYGMFISSTWEDDDGVEQTRLGVRYNELLAFIIAAI